MYTITLYASRIFVAALQTRARNRWKLYTKLNKTPVDNIKFSPFVRLNLQTSIQIFILFYLILFRYKDLKKSYISL